LSLPKIKKETLRELAKSIKRAIILQLMNSNKNWRLRIRKKVYKVLNKFPEKDRIRLVKVVEGLTPNPYAGDIEKIEDEENTWRRRVGAYRIFYEIRPLERVIYIFRVERRTSKTY